MLYNEFVYIPSTKWIYSLVHLLKTLKVYGFDFSGIKQDEKMLNTDVRKVSVIIKQAYTPNKLLPNVLAEYRVYVREGQTEVQVQDWTEFK